MVIGAKSKEEAYGRAGLGGRGVTAMDSLPAFLPWSSVLPPLFLPRAWPGQCGSLCLSPRTCLLSLDNDIVCGLEKVTAALACEGQMEKSEILDGVKT